MRAFCVLHPAERKNSGLAETALVLKEGGTLCGSRCAALRQQRHAG